MNKGVQGVAVHARELLDLSVDEVWALKKGAYTVQFDDIEAVGSEADIILSWYFWGLHRMYPNAPLLASHSTLGKRITKKLQLNLLSTILKDVWTAMGEVLDMEEVSREIYLITNRIFNDCTRNLGEYVTTVSILDLIDIVEHPAIKGPNEAAANMDVRNSSPKELDAAINYANTEAFKAINLAPELATNNVSKAVKADLLNEGQITQLISPRGRVTDIDSTIFRDPIMTGYVQGMRTLQDSAQESRSGAKALLNNTDPLEQTEFFNRRMQLCATSIRHLVPGDCGTTLTIPFQVRTKGDLNSLDGKYYVEGGKLYPVSSKDNHLKGKVIMLRTPIKCKHLPKQTVCYTCFGQMAYSVPSHTNIGHVCSTAVCAKSSQLVLSTKHYESNAGGSKLNLDRNARHYFLVVDAHNAVKLQRELRDKKVVLTILDEDAEHIGDISRLTADEIDELVVTRVSTISLVGVRIINEATGEVEQTTVSLQDGKLHTSLSHEMLKHMATVGWGLSSDGNFEVDMSGFDFDDPIFTIPMRHRSVLEFVKTLEAMIESKGDKSSVRVKKLESYKDAAAAVMDLHDIIAEKAHMNVVHLEIMIAAMLIVSKAKRDYNLPVPTDGEVEFGKYENILAMRSLATKMAYSNHSRVLASPTTYVVKNRLSHDMDNILFG